VQAVSSLVCPLAGPACATQRSLTKVVDPEWREPLEGWAGLFGSASVSLDHLELRDCYAVDAEDERYRWWREHRAELPREMHSWWDMTAATVARGVRIRRMRVVSMPVTEYIAFEHASAWQNVEAGEELRWLPRSQVSDLLLPGNDFWLVDGERVLFNLFDGDGRPLNGENSRSLWAREPGEYADPDEAFEVWHEECARSRDIVDAAESLDITGRHRGGDVFSLRYVLTHMIEEYARYNGHADLLRERGE
jgi:hypothetical protein